MCDGHVGAIVHTAHDGGHRGGDLAHPGGEGSLPQAGRFDWVAQHDAVTDDIAVRPLPSGQFVGWSDSGHGDEGLEEERHSVVDLVGHLDTRLTSGHHGQPPDLQHQTVALSRLETHLADQGQAGARHRPGQRPLRLALNLAGVFDGQVEPGGAGGRVRVRGSSQPLAQPGLDDHLDRLH